MNTMKKVLVTAVVSTGLLAGGSAFAFGGKHHDGGHKSERMMERKLKKLTKKLDLSEEQRAEMETLMRARQKRMRAAMIAEQRTFNAAIEGVLTAEQMAEFEELMGKRRKKFGEKLDEKLEEKSE